MSELITDEIVEAAAREFGAGRDLDPFQPDAVERARFASGDHAERVVERRREHQRSLVRPLLEAAAPLIAARALRESWAVHYQPDPTVLQCACGYIPCPGPGERERPYMLRHLGHDPRCISLTDGEFNDRCDCRTLRMIDREDRA